MVKKCLPDSLTWRCSGARFCRSTVAALRKSCGASATAAASRTGCGATAATPSGCSWTAAASQFVLNLMVRH